LRWSETFDLVLEPISVIAKICELPSKVVLLLTPAYFKCCLVSAVTDTHKHRKFALKQSAQEHLVLARHSQSRHVKPCTAETDKQGTTKRVHTIRRVHQWARSSKRASLEATSTTPSKHAYSGTIQHEVPLNQTNAELPQSISHNRGPRDTARACSLNS
jgi:hypothetical protein